MKNRYHKPVVPRQRAKEQYENDENKQIPKSLKYFSRTWRLFFPPTPRYNWPLVSIPDTKKGFWWKLSSIKIRKKMGKSAENKKLPRSSK